MRWMVEGCLNWQADQLAPPPAVSAATDDYLQAEDVLALWIGERCKRIGWGTTESSRLYADWRQWAIAAGEEPGSQKRFSQALQAKGYVKGKAGDRMAFEGIALNDVQPAWTERQHDRD